VADGTTGFIDYFQRILLEYPEKPIEFVRCIAEDDLVAIHIKYGQEIISTQPWISLVLIKGVKSVSIGTHPAGSKEICQS
jgi:predicted SnoaL-like aldol condensation-catalyzing enzyme